MIYLSGRNIVHRDIAARNLLVNSPTIGVRSYIVKVGDFGMSKLMFEGSAYNSTKKVFARQWSAPEVIQSQSFSTASDVFSFGTTLWELFSYAQVPFHTCSPSQAAERILKGNMLPQPAHCPTSIFRLIQQCWELDISSRPTFVEIFSVLNQPIEFPAIVIEPKATKSIATEASYVFSGYEIKTE